MAAVAKTCFGVLPGGTCPGCSGQTMTRAIDDQPDLSFRYFPDDCRWSYRLPIGLNAAPWAGAEIREVHSIGLRLQSRVGDDRPWFCEWAAEAEHLENAGCVLLNNGRRTSAAKYHFCAANYYHVGARFLHPSRMARRPVAAASNVSRVRPDARSDYVSGGCHAQ
jgi:hypothetical protein